MKELAKQLAIVAGGTMLGIVGITLAEKFGRGAYHWGSAKIQARKEDKEIKKDQATKKTATSKVTPINDTVVVDKTDEETNPPDASNNG